MQRSLAARLRAARSITLSILLLSSPQIFATTCESLSTLKLPNTTITLARSRAGGDLSSLDNKTPGPPLKGLPPFCRVAGTISPVPDSVIGFEVWMPTSNWNHRFMEVGNGGFSGAPSVRFMAAAVRNGYATASTDTGHHGDGADASFALGHPEKVIDFGYRSEHETTVKAKAIIAAFYGEPQKRVLLGRLFLRRQAGPHGSPALPRRLRRHHRRSPRQQLGTPHSPAPSGSNRPPTSRPPALCRRRSSPSSIRPRSMPATHPTASRMASSGTPSPATSIPRSPNAKALTPPPVSLPNRSKPRARSTPGLSIPAPTKKSFPASSPAARSPGTPSPRLSFRSRASHFRYVIFKDPKWDPSTLNFDTDIAIAEKVDSGTLTATNPNLKPFFAHGGKLILYHGLSDGLIAPQNTINYYNAVLKATGPAAANSMRLYLAPGMEHCFGGDGPSDFDLDAPLAAWVEDNKAPGPILALSLSRQRSAHQARPHPSPLPLPPGRKVQRHRKHRRRYQLRLRKTLNLHRRGYPSFPWLHR